MIQPYVKILMLYTDFGRKHGLSSHSDAALVIACVVLWSRKMLSRPSTRRFVSAPRGSSARFSVSAWSEFLTYAASTEHAEAG